MSQDVNTRQVFLNASQDGSVQSWGAPLASVAGNPEGFSVESYADRLMDDLFEDVERMLDGAAKRTTKQPVSPDPDPILAEEAPPSALPLVVRSQPDSHQEIVSAQPEPASTDLAPVLTRLEKPQQPVRSYDRLLLMVGCISLVATLAIWLVIQETRRQPVPVATSAQEPTSPEAQGDRQFADYMQQALQAIAHRTPASPMGGLPVASMPSGPGLQTVPVPLDPGSSPSNASQRIYVPVYQLPPNLSSSKATSSQKTPAVAPLPTVPTFPQAATPVKPSSSLATAGVVRTLVGVLELGDRSAALIEINGVAQRFRVGESIGTTGWMLVEISKNQAIIRRNGEVRSVFIGQSF